MFTALGAKLVFHQEDCRDVVRLENVLSGVSPFSFHTHLLIKVVAITVVIVLPVHKLQYVPHKSATLSMLSHVASGV